MNLATRLIIGVYAFLAILLVGSVLLAVTGQYDPISELLSMQQNNELFWVLIGVLSFLGLVSFILFVSSFRKSETSQDKYRVPTDFGAIGISKNSIESTALRSTRKMDGMRSVEVKSRISQKTQQVSLSISYTPFGPNPVQKNAKLLQEMIKRDLEDWLEVSVKEVQVHVKDASNESKKRERVI